MGLLFTSAGNAALIQAGVPAAAAVLAYLFLNERIPRKRLLGVGLSVLGVLLVSGAMPTGGDPLYLLGNALIVGSVLAYGAYASGCGAIVVDPAIAEKRRRFRAIEQLRAGKEGCKILPTCSHPQHLRSHPGGVPDPGRDPILTP